MKIDNNNTNRLNGSTDALNQTAATNATSATGTGKAPASASPKADQLTLSPEAQLLQAATDRAIADPGIRQEIVERMRALLDSGAIGNDAGRLADAIIDDVLKNK